MAMYFESCIPLLKPGWTAAFARFTMACGFALLSGYTQHAREFPARLGEAYDAERRRLSQDLHDEIGHDLIVLKLYAEMIALDMKNGDGADVRRKLRETVRLIQHAFANRPAADLRPRSGDLAGTGFPARGAPLLTTIQQANRNSHPARRWPAARRDARSLR
jgi:signal transduction histidine kinase